VLRWLRDIDPDDASVGGKAAGLARLVRAGLPVPDGFVLTPGPLDETALDEALGLLAAPTLAVRSSATCEDQRTTLAPGVFHSALGVMPGGVREAIGQVRASLDGPVARAYLARRGITGAAMVVIVQSEIPGQAVTVYTFAPGVPDHVLVDPPPQLLPRDAPSELIQLALACEQALGGFADVEAVVTGEGHTWIVQARPLHSAVVVDPGPWSGEVLGFSREWPDTLWTWDAAHNPAPLSPAQAGLVALVDAAGAAPLHQRVVHGYLYTAPHGAPRREIPPEELARVFEEELLPALEDKLGWIDRAGSLDEALAAYVAFYAVYAGVLGPAVSAAKRAPGGAPRLTRPLTASGDLSAVWDVAAPLLAGEHSAVDLAEADDLLFARAQAAIRRALALHATRRGISFDDVLHLPLGAAGDGALAAANRTRRVAQRSLTPPAHILGGRPLFAPVSGDGLILRGWGAGGQASGVVSLVEEGLRAPPGSIAVVPTVIPAMALLLGDIAGLVAEHGGPLGHGIALARELGIPCVVGCAGACKLLRSGEPVWIDGAAGVVVKL
jgi:phosphohistidine swiveling domain-containing protein